MNADTATAETNTTTTDTTQTTEVMLDDVYKEAGLDKAATEVTDTTQTQRQETARETQTTAVDPAKIPDPYSEEFKQYLAREQAGKTELEKAVRTMAAHLTAKAQQEAVATQRADIEKAVSTINETVNHPKPKVIEAALDGMVREDSRLRAIWNNRGKNPGAWNNALRIVTKQLAEDFSVRVDPKLVEAQRARKESQKQMATTTSQDSTSPVEERLGKAQGTDFDLEWERLKSGGVA